MRALCWIATFLLALLGVTLPAAAHVTLSGPLVSLSVALDWNNLARRAVMNPRIPVTAPAARRHPLPRLDVTSAPGVEPPPQVGTAVYGRVETWVRKVVIPQYVTPPDHERRFKLRTVYVLPFAPYVGCYGLNATFETDALLR
jgi:hypothetical protein